MTPGEVVRTPLAGAEVEPDSPDVPADEALSLPPAAPGRTAFLRRRPLTAVEAINRRDLDGYLSVFHPDVVIRIARLEGVASGAATSTSSTEGWRRCGGSWSNGSSPGTRSVSSRTRSWIREDSFIAVGEWVGTGRSGIEVRTPWPARFTLRGPLMARVDFYPSAQAARAAVGLAT